MNQTLVDVTDAVKVEIGDEVTLFGNKVNVFEVAEAMGTIAYEITSRIPVNVKRVYID